MPKLNDLTVDDNNIAKNKAVIMMKGELYNKIIQVLDLLFSIDEELLNKYV